MTLQEIFDKAARHLLTQMEKSLIGDSCAYRAMDGLKCVVGAFIPDDKYNTQLEGRSSDTEVICSILGIDVASEESRLFKALQLTHDIYEPIEWKKELNLIANDWSLSSKVLGEFK